MRGRGPVALAALLAVGVAGGFGASVAVDRQPAASGVPTPVAASPSYPVDPPRTYLPDDLTTPPLPADLRMARGSIGTGRFRYAFPVPAGWAATLLSSATTRWAEPDAPALTHFLRVELVRDDNETVARTREDRAVRLALAEDDFEPLGETADSLTYSYTVDGHQRFGILRWLRPTGYPFAEVEVAVTGRKVDLPGMRALVAAVAAGIDGP